MSAPLASIRSLAAVSPLGRSASELARALETTPAPPLTTAELVERPELTQLCGEPWLPECCGRPIEGFRIQQALERRERKLKKMMARPVPWVIAAGRAALAEAGIATPLERPDDFGLFAGSGFVVDEDNLFVPGLALSLDEAGGFSLQRWGRLGMDEIHPLWLVRGLSNNGVGFLSQLIDARGDNNNFCGQRPASLLALDEAAWSVAEGRSHHALAIGLDTLLNLEHLIGLGNEGRLRPPGQPDARGLWPSEGAAAVLLGPPRPGEVGVWAGASGRSLGEDDLAATTRRVLGEACQRAGVDPARLGAVWSTAAGEPAGQIERLGLAGAPRTPFVRWGDPGAAAGLLLAAAVAARLSESGRAGRGGRPEAVLSRGRDGLVAAQILAWCPEDPRPE